MRKIAVLDQNTIDKIAAGEVVERPASVVKELVENAIDAGSTAITVEIKEGGTSFIRVTDNGGGMVKDQVPLAFLRHATSKIQQVEDLQEISSLGFRGEALSSISAVAQVELITKTPDALTGTRYIIEGGIEKSAEEIGAPTGTTIIVRNLFFNTPARAKFLKTPVTEAGYVSSYMEQLALSHQHISFKFMTNGQTKLHSSGNSNLKDVIYGIYGREITKELIPVSYEKNGLKIEGFAGKPVIARGNRSFENYYINGRYVKNKVLMKSIEDAYKPYMMQHKYPFVCLHYEIPGDRVDVNVHPAKMEVRFQDQQEVYEGTYAMLTAVLDEKELIPDVELEQRKEKPAVKQEKIRIPEPFEEKRRQDAPVLPDRVKETKAEESYLRPAVHKEQKEAPAAGIRPAAVSPVSVSTSRESIQPLQPVTEQNKPMETRPTQQTAEPVQPVTEKPVEKQEKPKQMELFDDRLLSKKARIRHRIIGQLFDTYWLVEYDEKFYIIDQHAAHEKVLYEKFMKEFKERQILSQMISPPQIISLNLQQASLLKENLQLFRNFGFEIEPFGGKEYAISAVPSDIYGASVEDVFIDILDHLDQEAKNRTPDLITHRIATASCKAAVKGNMNLSFEEADRLIDELLSLEHPYHCPHGRPTIISMSKYELEKKFKRIV